jgi:hypothetical protein
VFFAVLPVQIAATVFLDGAWRRGAWGRVLVVVLLGAGAASAVGRIAWTLRQETAALAFVARATPPDAVILADQDTANGIAGLAGRKVVVPQHPDLFLVASGGWQRVLDVRRFLAAATPPEERDAILRRWQTTHVLLDRLATQGLPDLPYPVIHEEGGYVLYDVRSRSGIPR